MNSVTVENRSRDSRVVASAVLANTFWSRMRGLLGRPCPPAGEGLLLEPCNQVHMIGMAYPIDVAFISLEGVVLRVIRNLKPWRMTAPCLGARYALETGVGGLADLAEGDVVAFQPRG
jgi:hypothetical protein